MLPRPPAARIEPLEARIAPATIFGIDQNSNLLRFDSASPGTVTSVAITGLASPATERIEAIDFRPATGELYGFGSEDRLYVIDPETGAAAQVGADGGFATDPASVGHGFDFNPVADLIRYTDDFEANFRIDPATGAQVDFEPGTPGLQRDTDLAYAGSDPNAGLNPDSVGAAYTNNFAGATSTTLYGIDSVQDVLYRQGGSAMSPNGGQLSTVGALGINVADFPGNGPHAFDIETRRGGPDVAVAAMTVDGASSGLYTIDLATGAATLVGAIGSGSVLVRGMAVAPEGMTASIVGNAVTFYGGVTDDTLVIDQAGGLLRHNRFSAGDPGFSSDFDFAANAPGDQTLSATDPGVSITMRGRAGNDTLQIGKPASPAGGLAASFTLIGGSGRDLLIIEESAQAASFAYTINAAGVMRGAATLATFDGSLEQVSLGTGAGVDAVDSTFAGLTLVAMGSANGVTSQDGVRGADALIRGNTFTYPDLDGDLVRLTASRGAFALASFATLPNAAGTGLQLDRVSLAENDFTDANLTFTVKRGPLGDGFVNVGAISSIVDLGAVKIPGDIGQIDAGDGADDDTALAALTVHSLGALGTSTQLPGGSLVSEIKGRLGALNVKTDLLGARVAVSGAGGSIGDVFIGGDVIGESFASGGKVSATGSIGNVSIAGSLVGGSAPSTGVISSDTGSIGKVTIGGSVLGGSGPSSGSIQAAGPIGVIIIKGDLVGGDDGFAGAIFGGANIAAVTIGGALLGGTVVDPVNDTDSGSISAGGSIPGGVKIGGDVRGGNGTDGGAISAGGALGPVAIGGALVGGTELNTGTIRGDAGIASVKVGGDVRGGVRTELGTEFSTGGILSSAGSIGSVTLGGSLVATVIRAGKNLGAVTLGGDVRSDKTDGVSIHAIGIPDTAGGIQSITVKGSVTNALFAAGRFDPVNPDATIGAVKVGGDWIASNLVAGASPDADFAFGTADDVLHTEAAADAFFSTIKSVTIGGYVMGTVGGTDHFGFVAEKIGALKIGGVKVPLTAGLDKVGFAPGATGDVRVREVDSTPAVVPAPTLPASDNPLLYGVDQNNHLITFRADAPAGILSSSPITIGGAPLAADERIAGLDFRPADGGLYALSITDEGATNSGRLLRINPVTGAATAIGTPFSTTLPDTDQYGFDFDPVTDRIRVVSAGGVNVRLNPDDATAQTDSGVDPIRDVYSIAYDRSFIGGGATTLYGLEFQSGGLVRIGDVDGAPGSPNGGAVTPIGPFLASGFLEDSTLGGFDIESRTGVGYAALFDADAPNSHQMKLYTIDLTTGRATFVNPIGAVTDLRGLAVAQPVPDIAGPTSGKTLTYRDIDGDLVTVKTNKGTLDASMFTFAPGLLGSQLQRLTVPGIAFSGADITITATPDAGKGDGFANVGHINSSGPLGRITVDGDLGSMRALQAAALTARSLGRFGTSTQLPGGTLASDFDGGSLGRLTLKTDLVNASLNAIGAGASIGSVTLGGSILGGDAKTGLFAAGSIGNVTLGGSLVGGSATDSGKIDAGTTLGKVTVGGSLLGGAAESAGMIESRAGMMGAVAIRGELVGCTQTNAGAIFAKGNLTSATIGGSVIGGAGAFAGSITADVGVRASLGPVKIGGSLLGGGGLLSASVSGGEQLGAVSVTGSVVGGGEFASGAISGVKGIASVKIGRDLRGGAGLNSGSILSSQGSIGPVAIGGSFAGSDAADTGIFSDGTLGKVTVGGSLRGDADDGVRIQAKGILDPASATKAAAIASLSVKGSVRSALVLAGFDDFNIDNPLNPDAGIGAVSIGGNFLATSIIAGATRGGDDLFGTADDEKAGGETTADAIFSRVASVIVKGFAVGTPGASGDHFGLVAERVGKVKAGAGTYALPFPDRLTGLALGASGDLRIREV